MGNRSFVSMYNPEPGRSRTVRLPKNVEIKVFDKVPKLKFQILAWETRWWEPPQYWRLEGIWNSWIQRWWAEKVQAFKKWRRTRRTDTITFYGLSLMITRAEYWRLKSIE
jgi:hypothetical protein